MRSSALLLLLGCTGCAVPFFNKATSPAGNPYEIDLHHHVVRYQMLAQTTAESCASLEQVRQSDAKTTDPRAIGSPLLFEMAKYNAIGKVADADGLVALRAKVEYRGGDECVTVSGRAYRIVAMAAAPDSACTLDAGDSKKPATEKTVDPDDIQRPGGT